MKQLCYKIVILTLVVQIDNSKLLVCKIGEMYMQNHLLFDVGLCSDYQLFQVQFCTL